MLSIEMHGAVANFELPKGVFFFVETVTFVFNRGLQCGRLLTSRNR